MSVVIVGGHDRMVQQYKQVCKAHRCKAKVFTKKQAISETRSEVRMPLLFLQIPYRIRW